MMMIGCRVSSMVGEILCFITACQAVFRAVSWGLSVEKDHGVGVP